MKTHRVLVVEDEKDNMDLFCQILEFHGCQVLKAEDGREAVNLTQSEKPDLILLDLMLPGIDGFSVLQSIRLEDEKLPILILSAKAGPDDRVRGLAHAVDDYLAKPFNPRELLARIAKGGMAEAEHVTRAMGWRCLPAPTAGGTTRSRSTCARAARPTPSTP